LSNRIIADSADEPIVPPRLNVPVATIDSLLPTDGSVERPRSLTSRALRGGLWVAAFRTAGRAIGFVRNVALARILSPDDIGLFGLVLVVLSILERFSDTGLESALVQKRDRIEDYLDSAWTVLLLRRVLLALSIAVLAPAIAGFFDEPRATPLFQLLGLSIFIHAFTNIGVVLYRRELEMGRQAIHSFSGMVVDLAVSISLALYLRSAWALMFGLVASRLVSVGVSYLVHPYRPRFRLDGGQTRELARFGRWVFANKALNFFASRGDNLVVGKVLGPPALGVYMLAFSISEAATVELARMANTVAFPAYARAQHKKDRIREAFLTTTELVAAVSLPLALLLALLAMPLTQVVLGEQWLGVASVLPLLAFASAVRSIVANAAVVSKGLGHPEHSVQANLLQVSVMYLAMFPLIYRFGLVGVAYSVLLGSFAPVPLMFRHTFSLLGIGASRVLVALIPAAVLSGSILGSVWISEQIGPDDSTLLLLLSLGIAAAAAIAASVLLWTRFAVGPLRILMMIRANRRASGAQQGAERPAAL
jgi:lipopolysaccharide exporter